MRLHAVALSHLLKGNTHLKEALVHAAHFSMSPQDALDYQVGAARLNKQQQTYRHEEVSIRT